MRKLGLLSMFTLAVAMAATVNSNYDVDACETRCQDNAKNSDAYQDKADDCQACIDDRSCAGAVFGCGAECAGIVP